MQSTFVKCHGCSSKRAAGVARSSRTSSRRPFRVYAVNHDPENLFKGLPVAEGIIERRIMSKQMQTDKQFAALVTQAQDDDRKKLLLRRQSRTPPTDHIELVEFFLNTQADDMEVREGNINGARSLWQAGKPAVLLSLRGVTTLLPTAMWTAAIRMLHMCKQSPQCLPDAAPCCCDAAEVSMSGSRSAERCSVRWPASNGLFPAGLCCVMQFEVARCRPQLTTDFFKQLDTMIGQVRRSAGSTVSPS